MKSVFVLGGTGFVGRHVCEKLVREGWHVTVPTRKRSNAIGIQPLPSLTVLECDVHDTAALGHAVQGHEAVVNLVAILHGKQAAFERVHVQLPQKIGQTCANADVGKLVHISALGAHVQQADTLPSMYLQSKSRGEAELLAHGRHLALTILRPSVIFGAEDRFLNLFAHLQRIAPFVPLAHADARFQPVWVEDVASAVVRSLDRTQPGVHTLQACGPEVFTLKQLVQLSGALAGIAHGHGRPVLPVPHWLGLMQAWLLEHMPGEPLMSRDNLHSMLLPNVADPGMPDVQELGIQPAALLPIASEYLSRRKPWHERVAVRKRAHGG